MASRDNVIELKNFFKKKTSKAKLESARGAEVVSMEEQRQHQILEDRRKVKRTILTEFVGAAVVLPGKGLVTVTLSDVSQGGLGFDIEKKYGQFKQGEKVVLRVYLNYKTFFSIILNMEHIRFVPDEQVYRHGASFVKDSFNEEAIHHFIKFIECVNPSLSSDWGDLLLTK